MKMSDMSAYSGEAHYISEYAWQDSANYEVLGSTSLRNYPGEGDRTVYFVHYCSDMDTFGYSDALCVSNYGALLFMLRQADIPDVWRILSWTNTNSIAIDGNAELPEDIALTIQNLEDYPVIDEDDYNNVEYSFIDEWWKTYGGDELRRAAVRLAEARNLTDRAEKLDECELDDLAYAARTWTWDHSEERLEHEDVVYDRETWSELVAYIVETWPIPEH